MSKENIALVASALTNSRGTTILGHVTPHNANVRVVLPDNQRINATIDPSGDFLVPVPSHITKGMVTVTAVLPDDSDSFTMVETEIKSPKPVVTGVLATRGGKRYLEGSANQHNLHIVLWIAERPEPINIATDANNGFEVEVPQDVTAPMLHVIATNPLTGEQGVGDITVGVTTETTTVPILTDEVIAAYVSQASDSSLAQQKTGTMPVVNDNHPDEEEVAAARVAAHAARHTEVHVQEEVMQRSNHKKSGSAIGRFFRALFGK